MWTKIDPALAMMDETHNHALESEQEAIAVCEGYETPRLRVYV